MKLPAEFTGLESRCLYQGKPVRFFNQSHKGWTHPYEYQNNGSNLHSAGCGIFSLAVVIQRMCGLEADVNALADFSCSCGGRGDDGTDRPALLAGLTKAGLAEKYGFRYDGDGLVNDHEQLWQTLSAGGCAMCNLRVGHIVAVIDCRLQDGERQMLVVDSAHESDAPKVREKVRQVLPGSEILNPCVNQAGLTVGASASYAMYWMPVSAAIDFNLLHKIS